MTGKRGTVSERFWAKVDKSGECWLWTGARVSTGYGRLLGSNGKHYTASRLSWILEHGPIADGLCVLHRCDTPACVRPAHLFLGTMKDNTADARAKGRLRGWKAGVTHCPHGHEYTPENTYQVIRGGVLVGRSCKACQCGRSKVRYAERQRTRAAARPSLKLEARNG